ncbi:GFA family protein [Xanthobacter dioxanivorans]|uniref:GFA family protein n=1 Tax=Xanthobacter dioxanivorans TaxID=2528964 RepID=A0A974PKQ4_9HYPH|nr:GFA family protein [Xanthobacter dioxanivorans]QRG05294.1 GFA family protein [Xanthobacter dioxanivorans]
MAPLTGGCLCGRLRYGVRRVQSAYWCHCTMCRRVSGAGALPWATVMRQDFAFTQGTPATYASSPGVVRAFCGTCGSPILFDMAAEAAVDVTLGTLDDPDAVRPDHHIWAETALQMSAGLGAGLPRHAAERPAEPE